MMELDPKYASVILRRAVENSIAPEDIFVERGGEKIVNPSRHIFFQHDDLVWFVSPEELTITGFERKMVEM